MSRVPESWMPAAKMVRIINHWTAGTHKASSVDKSHYHILVEGDGSLVRGDPTIDMNQKPLKQGYAAHTLNCNTGSVGVSCCAMAGAKENPFDAGKYPLTKKQWDQMVLVNAALSQRYNIPVTPETVLTHAEVQDNLGIQQRGKWDYTRLAFDAKVKGARAVGDRLRAEVLSTLKTDPAVADIPDKSLPPPSIRKRMAATILSYEARRDSKGRLAVYDLPPQDGGGTYEVAGINDRYHPMQAAKLKGLIEAGKYAEAEDAAENYILAYTDAAAQWHKDPGVEFYLRDSFFNRGPKGAARILQIALGVEDDGVVGPGTRAAMASVTAADLLTRLRAAREEYEREVVGYREVFWRGLTNRWNNALAAAKKFQAEGAPLVAPGTAKTTTGAVVAGGVATGAEMKRQGFEWVTILPVVIIIIGVALLVWKLWPRRKD